jgi:hypothetical protein
MSPERSRRGNRWSVNECLQLQREFELLNLSIDEIANRHKRTPSAIMNKLDREGFADYNVLYSNYYGLNSYIPTEGTNNEEEEEEEEDANLEDQDYSPEEDEDDDDDDENWVGDVEEVIDDVDDIKQHVMRLEKQVTALTEMFMKQTKNHKSVFSLFA